MIVSQLQPVRVPSNTSRPQTSAPPAVAALPQPARKVWRKVWLNLHLYIGLLGGALFVLTSLTGSLLVFYKTIDEWMNPEQLVRTAGADLPLNQIVAAPKLRIRTGPCPTVSSFRSTRKTASTPGSKFQVTAPTATTGGL
jgi:uncharacterized iron-regulated membrane protein